MLVIGLLLVLLAALALVAALTAGGDDPAVFDLGIVTVETNTLGAFLLGAATLLVFVIGLELIRSGVRRANRRRKEHRELARRAEQLEAQEAAKQRDTAPTQTERPERTERTEPTGPRHAETTRSDDPTIADPKRPDDQRS